MTTQKQDKQLKRIAGFTLDQTILVVAVIAILATIIISSVAWSVLNRANATRMTAHLTQIADSIGNYYQDNSRDWPADAEDLKVYLAGYTASGNNLITPFGASGADSIMAFQPLGAHLTTAGAAGTACNAAGGVDCYFTVTLTNIQAQEAQEANSAIDGPSESTPNTQGRFRWTAGAGTTRVTVTYFAVKRP